MLSRPLLVGDYFPGRKGPRKHATPSLATTDRKLLSLATPWRRLGAGAFRKWVGGAVDSPVFGKRVVSTRLQMFTISARRPIAARTGARYNGAVPDLS